MVGSAEMEEIAPSSCRPPWLDTMMASAPLCAASSASTGSRMPFRISLPPQRSLMRFTSSQLSVGSNCSAVQADSSRMSFTPLTWPTMLRNSRRLVPSMPVHQRGLVAMLAMLASVSLGGALKPFLHVLVALRQDLQIEREHQGGAAGGLGAADQAVDEVAVLHHVELEPERLARILGHVLDGADAHGRQRERYADGRCRSRRQDLAVGVLHAGHAHGRERHRHG